jgi:hypothetical protein
VDGVKKEPALPDDKPVGDEPSELDEFLTLTKALLKVSKKDLDAERKREAKKS